MIKILQNQKTFEKATKIYKKTIGNEPYQPLLTLLQKLNLCINNIEKTIKPTKSIISPYFKAEKNE